MRVYVCVMSVESLDSAGAELCPSVPQLGSGSHASATFKPHSRATRRPHRLNDRHDRQITSLLAT